ncbi:MAG: TetR/AcrR family transcriptional regulator [Kordiimonadaceae bacterium]|nr:TetR/AcrR family transcriptional regulator [Kordiimonadaceae bacterium]
MPRGRPRKIDPEIVLEKAMTLFWEKGYDGTSMSDLVQATNMAKPGIYATFGDKEQLYLKALAHYFECAGKELFHELAHSEQPLYEAVKTFYEVIMHGVQQPDGPRGCLVLNTLVEFAHKAKAPNEIGKDINDLRTTAFATRLARAKAEGELKADTDIESLTHFLSGQTLAIGVMGRSGDSAKAIQGLVDVALSVLPNANAKKP